MLQHFLLALFLLALSGCSTPRPAVALWYYAPPHNTPTTLYGVGEGVDLASAKVMALSQIAHGISMTLQSRYDKRDQSIRFNAQEQTLQEIEHHITTQAQTLHFSEVHVDKEQWIAGRLYVLVRMDRATLYAQEQRRLQERLNTFRRRFDQMAVRSSLEQFVQLQQFHDAAESLRNRIALLHAIDATRDTSGYRHIIAQYEDRYAVQKNALHLKVVADAVSRGFERIVRQQLLKVGITVDNVGSDGIIDLTSQSKKEQLAGYNIEQCHLHVKCRDGNAMTVASREYVFVGTSRIDFSQSHHDCVQQFASQVTQEGIFKSLGL